VPCIVCVAVFAVRAGPVTTAVVDRLEARLASIADGPVERLVDSGSVARFELGVNVRDAVGRRGRAVPVAMTLYKEHARVRIQVLTHELTRAEAETVEDLVARALELTIIDRSDAHDEKKVREAFGEVGAT
jgi:septal ring factor EnvC (AmiA/AmiB activator)